MKYLNVFTLVLVISLYSCNSTNKTVTPTSENESQVMSKKMIDEGFTAGEISFSKKEGDCPVTIKIESKGGVYYYDPINLSEEFKIEGEKIWFKFAGLRRMNRCDKASPINIIEIKKQ